MFRVLLCGLVALLMFTGLSEAKGKAKKEKGTAAHGHFVSFDHGKLTITNKKQGDKTFDVAPATSVNVWKKGEGQSQKLNAAQGLKDLGPKDRIVVHLNKQGKVVSVGVNAPRKMKRKNKAA